MKTRRFRPCLGHRPSLDLLPPRIAPSDITVMLYLDGGVDATGTEDVGDPGSLPISPVWTGPSAPPPIDSSGLTAATPASSMTPVLAS